jgi:hypothetical protein
VCANDLKQPNEIDEPRQRRGKQSSRAVDSHQIPLRARFCIDSVIVAGICLWMYAALHHPFQPLRSRALFCACVVTAVAAATLKIRLPGVNGTFSLGFVGSLVAIQQLGLMESLAIGSIVGIIQCVWNPVRRPLPIQILFNAANFSNSTAVAYAVYRGWLLSDAGTQSTAQLFWAAALFYTVNTGTVAGVLSLLERKPLANMFQHWCLWSFWYFAAGALIARFAIHLVALAAFPIALLLPIIGTYLIYRGYMTVRGSTNASKVNEHAFPCHGNIC